MSDYNNNFDIDDILAEFASFSETIANEPLPPEKPVEKPAKKPVKKPVQPEIFKPLNVEHEIVEPEYTEPEYELTPEPVKAKYAPEKPVRRKKTEAPKKTEKKKTKEPTEYKREKKRVIPEIDTERLRTAAGPLKAAITVVFVFITLFTFLWIAKNVHPDSGTVTASSVQNNTNLVSRLDMYMNNAKSEALGDLAYIKKIYTIPETDTVAPAPDERAFGVTSDMAVIQQVIDDASELLEGQSVAWRPDLDFYPDNNVYYYRDATILALVWRERINNRSATVAEIKVADGSQLRRKLAEDTYGSSVQSYASKLAQSANAVVAMNADFYGFRQIGVTVYQRQLFRFSPDKLDNCFINSKGEMLFVRAGGIQDEAQMYRYMADNDVLFSLSFGPILVDDGVLQHCDGYPIGEMDREYSRAGLGMLDDLHYLYMTVNHCNGQNPRCNVNEFAELMYSKGCFKAYNLDGGQTSEIVFHNVPINYIDFNAERTVTDIIYFATALPESEVSP